MRSETSVRSESRRHSAPTAKFWHDHTLGCDLGRAHVLGHAFPRHSHDTFIVIVSQRGTLRFVRSRQSEEVGAGAVMTLWPDEPHAGCPSPVDGWCYRAIYPSPSAVSALSAELLGRPVGLPNFTGIIRDQRLAAQLVAAHVMIENGEPMERESAFLWGVGELISRARRVDLAEIPSAVPPRCIARSVEFIHAHYCEPLSIRELCSLAACTAFQFIRAFQRTTGMSVHAYLNRVRLSNACRRLANGQAAAEVAAAVGFTDQSHLIRRFRQAYGVTPGAYVRDSRH